MNQTRLISQIVNLTLVMLLSIGCNAAQPAPTLPPVPPTATASPEKIASLNPSPRAYTSMSYDAESDRVILFGGQTGNYNNPDNFNGETWAYDVAANKWTQTNPISGPSGRAAPEMAYDAESDRVILFGGVLPSLETLNDTWAFDYNTNTWKEMKAKGPTLHLGARLAYDAESDRIILFGGYDLPGSFLYNDTWAYDFNSDTWTEMKPSISPPGRNYQAMTYDSKADRILTWGGSDVRGNFDMSVWSYDFNTNAWQEIKPGEGTIPSGRDYPIMVYNAESDRTILFGGSLGGKETWAYDNNANTWTKLQPSTIPSPRSRHVMVYSVAADQVILFGGQVGSREFNYSSETWAYDFNSNTWRNVTPQH